MSALETQVGGDHYKKMPIQPMEYSMANKLDACQHTIVKYVTRFREKGGIQDLEKARHVIDMLIEFESKREPVAANDNGDWIEWNDTGNPPEGKLFDVRLRNGQVLTDQETTPMSWAHCWGMADIMAYRIAKG